MQIIAKCLGGSHMYGLNGPNSDLDYRGVFLNDTIHDIIGLGRHDHQQKQEGEKDEVFVELRHALRQLQNANTQVIELIYNNNWIEIKDEWKRVQENKEKLLSSERLFSCLRGYMQGELKLANGSRQGKLGGKRKLAVETYSFSPKNFVQYFRLSWAGCIYFKNGYFPTNVFKEDVEYGNWLLNIKNTPQNFEVNYLNDKALEAENKLIEEYKNRNFDTKFSIDIANELCSNIYFPFLKNAQKEQLDKI